MEVQILHARGNFEGAEKGRPIVKYRDSLPWAVQKRWTDWDVVWYVVSKEACIRWVHIFVHMRLWCGFFVVKLLWPLVSSSSSSSSTQYWWCACFDRTYVMMRCHWRIWVRRRRPSQRLLMISCCISREAPTAGDRSLQLDAVVIIIVIIIEKFLITFCVSRRRCKMYCGHAHLCVCLYVCPRLHA